MKLFSVVNISKNKVVDSFGSKEDAKKLRNELNLEHSKDKENPVFLYKISAGPDHWKSKK